MQVLICSLQHPHDLQYLDHFFSNVVNSCFSFVDKTEKRYNQNMSPAIPKDKWRKGSQVVSWPFCPYRYFSAY